MGKYDEQVKAAEEAMRKEKFIIAEAARIYKNSSVSMYDATVMARERAEHVDLKGKFDPKQGTIKVEHDHGFILMDLEGFKALPKAQQTKVLKLGGQ
ncbi:MAG: hypothetical protein VB018_09520 [Lachnospiraceae bacterium]|nr:hypothetical protein [Lachnospiraceae bacterium]